MVTTNGQRAGRSVRVKNVIVLCSAYGSPHSAKHRFKIAIKPLAGAIKRANRLQRPGVIR